MKNLRQLIEPVEVLASNVDFLSEVKEISADSRKIGPGVLFIAIRGTKVDGHSFVESAERAGSIVVVDRPEVYDHCKKAILVFSTRELIGKLMSRYCDEPTSKFSLVGVTGTNGKTTTTFLLDQTCRGMGLRTGIIGTVENRVVDKIYPTELTTPGPIELQNLFLEMARSKVDVATMEVTSIALDQFRPNGSHFKIGVFTNFSQDHLDYHRDMESYFKAKLKLFRDYEVTTMVVNADDPKGARLIKDAAVEQTIRFSIKDPTAEFYANEITYDKSGTVCQLKVSAKFGKGAEECKRVMRTPLIGKHNVYNSLCVLATIGALGKDLDQALKVMETAPGAPGRLERVMFGPTFPNIFVDYAHTDDALKNVLEALKPLVKESNRSGKLITVFGCGGDRDKLKRPKMGAVVSQYSDITIATSDNPRTEAPLDIIRDIEPGIEKSKTEYLCEVDRKKAIHLALEMGKPEDIILVAGKGHETYQILGTEKVDFDDRAVIRDYYL